MEEYNTLTGVANTIKNSARKNHNAHHLSSERYLKEQSSYPLAGTTTIATSDQQRGVGQGAGGPQETLNQSIDSVGLSSDVLKYANEVMPENSYMYGAPKMSDAKQRMNKIGRFRLNDSSTIMQPGYQDLDHLSSLPS